MWLVYKIWLSQVKGMVDFSVMYMYSVHINPNRPQSNKIQQGEVKKMR